MTNTLRHVIVEGPDGSGKDTLIKSLLDLLPDHTLHPRASTSTGGPVNNLAQWVSMDMHSMPVKKPSIYNRHPLISEMIYAKYRRPPGHREAEWTYAAWRNAMLTHARKFAIVVMCLPPAYKVRETVMMQGPEAHMPGVYDHILDIYTDYQQPVWRGIQINYNYMTTSPQQLLTKINRAFTHGRV